MYNAYVVKIKDLRKHSNADRLQIATVFGNDVVVGLDTQIGDICVYFPCDGQLSEEYAIQNNLVRRKDENGAEVGGYMHPQKRNVTAIRLRGEKSDGLIMPIKSLESFGDIVELKEGDTINTFNGHEICRKYIPIKRYSGTSSPTVKKPKVNHFPQFFEHKDTAQLVYNLNEFKSGDECVITLKVHGTSARTGYLQKVVEKKQNFWQRLLRKPIEVEREYKLISGTRRVVLEDMNANLGFYGSNDFRAKWHDFFDGKLMKGETIYYEIIGATGPNVLIMPSCDNKKLKDKEFLKKYGPTTVFSYGCDIEKGENDIYVYRMTMVNEDGYVVEYPWDLVKARCEQMAVKHVPELRRFIVESSENCPKDEFVMDIANQYTDGSDLIDPSHIREGCVVRINNSPTFRAYKNKGFNFKVLEGIIKEAAIEPDMEEKEDF